VTFFESKQAAAVLKHALLKRYIPLFVGKTGSTSAGGRVAFVDGYAGAGSYEDGQDGSPILVMEEAHALTAKARDLHCIFVERDPEAFGKLSSAVATQGVGLTTTVLHGDVEQHLDRIKALVANQPVLYFFDPFGRMFPLASVAELFAGRSKGYGAPATELMVNFNASNLRRTAGHLTSPTALPATLAGMDDMCGGDWWREVWLDHLPDKDSAEAAVVAGYAQRLSTAAGGAGRWIIDVRNRPANKPVYYLVFLSGHSDGLSLMGESLSLGMQDWRHFLHKQEYAGSLLDEEYSENLFKTLEIANTTAWTHEIEGNLERLLAEGAAFRIIDRYGDVYGSALGLARQTHLRAAWARVYEAGLTTTDSKGKDLIKKVITPA